MSTPRDLNVLMISLDTALLNPDSDSRARHLVFAELAGKLTIIVRTVGGSRELIHAAPSLTLVPTGGSHKLKFPLDAIQIADELNRTSTQFDLIVTQDLFMTGLAGARLRGRLDAPLLAQVHSSVLDSPMWLAEYPIRNRLALMLARWVLRRCDFLRTVNEHEHRAALRLGMPSERTAALPLATISAAFAAPIDRVRVERLRGELGIALDEKLVLWFGYPARFKRIPMLFEVFKRVLEHVPNARLLMVGDMSRSPVDLAELAQKVGISKKAIFHAAVPHEALPAYYALGADGRGVYALTSAYEGLVRVLYEAGVARLPAIAFDVLGANEVIRDGVNGYLIRDGDLDGFTTRVVELLGAPEHARQLGEKGREMALERFNAETYPERWVGLWREAVRLGKRKN